MTCNKGLWPESNRWAIKCNFEKWWKGKVTHMSLPTISSLRTIKRKRGKSASLRELDAWWKSKWTMSWVVPFTWMQVSEAVQGQTLNVETHLELEGSCLHQCLSKQPAVLLSCNSTTMCTQIHRRSVYIKKPYINTIWQYWHTKAEAEIVRRS